MNSQVAEGRLAANRLRSLSARLAPGAGGFFSWWGRTLASWLPLRTRQALGVDRGRLLLQVDGGAQGGAIRLRLQQADQVQELATLPDLSAWNSGAPADAAADPLAPLLPPRIGELPRWLLLPPATSLRRRLNLPAAAADRLRDVVGFEIDRQTPFTAEAVAFDARVLARRDGDGQIEAELVAVPRQALDPQLHAIGPLAATLAGIDVAGADGVPLGVNLLPPAQRRARRDPFRYWNLALAAVALLALAAGMWQVLDNRRAAIKDLQQTIARNANAARQAASQRQEVVDLIEGQAFLDRTRAARPSTVQIIDELSRRMPDSTYLEKLAIEDESLLMIGLSREASSLIGKLQGTPLWRSPALTGAVQPDPATGRDRFTLTAEIGPPKAQNAEGARGP
ncbi:PilN domain-containing protein [Lysobacter yananisis]|uniref:PilN domain-containing protein n=1 Tax=Lysobacter yananisis TaxID=1003114 RepID=A0ABY9PFK7_9GAMM|nr:MULTISPECIES: PilN domain-containing protein [Lysobacter]UZW61683.1 PilN domain-containing protein [Lysobacter enzymogenes]WMT05550.1 PilN domain-containing protein [Lysobacter yananisis]